MTYRPPRSGVLPPDPRVSTPEQRGTILPFRERDLAPVVVLNRVRLGNVTDDPWSRSTVFVRASNGCAGSGVVVAHKDGKAFVLTAHHVIEGARSASIYWPTTGEESTSTTDLRRDKYDYDLAAVVVDVDASSVPRVAPIAATGPTQGEAIRLCGYGGGRWRNLTGKVLGYQDYFSSRTRKGELVVSPQAISGDSGGPIYNAKGETVGVLWGFWGDGRKTHAAPQKAIADFAKRCGWLIGPNITIENPAPVQPIQAGPDPAVAAKVDSLEREIADLKAAQQSQEQRLQRVEFVATKAEDLYRMGEPFIREKWPQLEAKLNALEGGLGTKIGERLSEYDAGVKADFKRLEINQQTIDGKVDDTAALALRTDNAVAETKTELSKLERLYNVVPDSVKSHVADRIHEKLDGLATPELVTQGLTALDSRLSGKVQQAVDEADKAKGDAGNAWFLGGGLGGGGLLMGLAGIGLALLKARHPEAGAAIEIGRSIVAGIRELRKDQQPQASA